MVNEEISDFKGNEKALDILESNFLECLKHLNQYIIFTLVVSIAYLAIIISPQKLLIPGSTVGFEGEFALALLSVIYIAAGAMATYVAERTNKIAVILIDCRPVRFEALQLRPSIGANNVPVVPFLVSFVPPTIFSLHLGYLGYINSNGGVVIPIVLYIGIGFTLWSLLPIGNST